MSTLAERGSCLLREVVRECPGRLRLFLLLLWSLGCTMLMFMLLVVVSETWTGGRPQATVTGGVVFTLLLLAAVAVGWAGRTRSELSQCARDLHVSSPRSPWGPWWLFWPLVCAGFVAIAVTVGTWFAGQFTRTAAQVKASLERSTTLTGGVVTQVLHAAGEEFLYRGVMLVAVMAVMLLVSRRRPRVRAALMAAAVATSIVLFAVAHLEYGVANVLSCAVTGTGYAVSAVVSRSVWPAVAMHAGYNVVVLM